MDKQIPPGKTLTQAQINRFEELAELGVPISSILIDLGVSSSKHHRDIKNDPELQRLHDRARIGMEFKLSKKMHEMALGGNFSALKYCLAAKHRWVEANDDDAQESRTPEKHIIPIRELHPNASGRQTS